MAEGPGRVQEGFDPSEFGSTGRMVQLRAMMIVDRRARLLLVALGFLRLEGQLPPVLLTLHRWLDTWRGIGHVAVGMARQGFDLQLTRYDERGWRATFYMSGMEHSPTSATGTAWERTPWRAAQQAAWEVLSRDGLRVAREERQRSS